MAETAAASAARLLVPMDTATMSTRALEMAAGLAATLDADLEGLFVEDTDLVRLAGLPFAREISAVTGVWTALAPSAVERSLRLEAERLERLVAQAAERARVSWSFATARGRLLAEAVAREADLILLGAASRAPRTGGSPGAPGREHGLRGALAVLADTAAGSLRALEIARQLAAGFRIDLRVLVPQSGTPETDTPALDRVRSWLVASGHAGVSLPLRSGEGALAEALRASRAGLLICAAPDLAQSLAALGALASDLYCPLLVVREQSAPRSPRPPKSPADRDAAIVRAGVDLPQGRSPQPK